MYSSILEIVGTTIIKMNSDRQTFPSNFNWSEIYYAANSHVKEERWDEAIAAYYQAIELNPSFFWSYQNLGNALTKLQHWGEAAVIYRRAIEIDSSFFWSYHNLGDALTKLQHWEEAAVIYRRAIEIDSNFFWSHHNLGDVLTRLEHWDEAIAAYLNAITIDLNAPLIYQKLGTALKLRGNLIESIQYYRQIIRNPEPYTVYSCLKQHSLILRHIARNLVRSRQIAGAIVLYYTILEIEPERLELLPQLTKLLQKYYRLQQEVDLRQQQIAGNPQRLSHYHSAIDTTQTKLTTKKKEKFLLTCDRDIAPHLLVSLFQIVGWQPRSLERMQKAIAESFLVVTIWEVGSHPHRLSGFARVVSDGVFHATILDLVIHPDFQNRGLGKSMISYIIKQLQTAKIDDIILLASPTVVDFYHNLGFISQPNNLQWMLWCPKK
jgi:tetratricopeptide (TPR) repeat protein